jgi:hypothetical protein
MPGSPFLEFPSIEQFRNVIKDVNRTKGTTNSPKITFHGTVKLHGTNAGIGLTKEDRFWAQSRKHLVTPETDNYGFGEYVYNNEEYFTDILKEIRTRFNGTTVLFFGEWCGDNIQTNVALQKLPKMFVMYAIRVDDNWYNHNEIKSYFYHNINFYNIDEFPTWDLEIDFSNPEFIQYKLCELTEFVEKCCPVAKQLGVEGTGEGIVWTAKFNDNMIRFKVKGKEHSVTKVKILASLDIEKVKNVIDFVGNFLNFISAINFCEIRLF